MITRRCFSILTALLIAGSAHALDKNWMATHIRKSFNVDPKVSITVGDPKPSKIGNLLVVPVTFQGNQTQNAYLTPDGKKYVWGNVFDLTIDPDLDRISKISLSNVYVKGLSTAPVTIVEYSDMQCPHCQKAYIMLRDELFKAYPENEGKVKLVFKQYPLSMHEWAESAAMATECVGLQKKEFFWEVMDYMFVNSETITLQTVKEKAVKSLDGKGLDVAKFDQCFDKKEMLSKIQAEKNEGTSVGVSATPSFVVNGRLVRGGRFEDIKNVIEEKLAEANKK